MLRARLEGCWALDRHRKRPGVTLHVTNHRRVTAPRVGVTDHVTARDDPHPSVTHPGRHRATMGGVTARSADGSRHSAHGSEVQQ